MSIAVYGPDVDLAYLIDHADGCLQADPEAFHPEVGGSSKQVKSLCAGCPVKVACREYALTRCYPGIWGGTSTEERETMRRERRLEDEHEVAA